MSNEFNTFVSNMINRPELVADQLRAYMRSLEPKDNADQMASAITISPVPLKLKMWKKADQKVREFHDMATEDWPVCMPSPADRLEVLQLQLKKKITAYATMQDVADNKELTASADAVGAALKTLDSVILLLGKFDEEYHAAKVAEVAFVKTLG